MFRVFLTGEMTDKKVAERVLGSYGITYEMTLEGYTTEQFHNKSYIKVSTGSTCKGMLFELDEEQLWRLDRWKGVPLFNRVEILPENEQNSVLVYTINGDFPLCNDTDDMESQLKAFERNLQYSEKKQDVFLLFPCAVVEKETGNDEEFVSSFHETSLVTKEHFFAEEEDDEELCSFFLAKMKQYNNEEFDGKFFRKIRRTSLGTIKLQVMLEKEEFCQYGFAFSGIHPQTAVGMMGIVIPAVSVPTELLLCASCAESLKIADSNGYIKVRDWMLRHGLEAYGSSKAVVFSYSPMSQDEILRTLACEMYPIGELVGETMQEWSKDNFAQYDIAQVYASDRCLLEISTMQTGMSMLKERLNVEAVELFFMELLMMQEAAVARVSDKTYELFNDGTYMKTGSDIQEKLLTLSQEAANAVLFVNYGKLRFPTVRISCKKIAERFGIEEEMDNYQRCRQMLEQMIAINTSEAENLESNLMNLLLLFLTMVQVLPVIADLARYLMTNTVTGTDISSTLVGTVSCISLYLVYRLTYRHAERKKQKRLWGKNRIINAKKGEKNEW